METSILSSMRSSSLEQPPTHSEAVQTAEQYNLTWHEMKLHRLQRAEHKLQRPCVLWFTGLCGAGKIKQFTGIDSDYEIPEQADILLNSATDCTSRDRS